MFKKVNPKNKISAYFRSSYYNTMFRSSSTGLWATIEGAPTITTQTTKTTQDFFWDMPGYEMFVTSLPQRITNLLSCQLFVGASNQLCCYCHGVIIYEWKWRSHRTQRNTDSGTPSTDYYGSVSTSNVKAEQAYIANEDIQLSISSQVHAIGQN